MAADSQTAAVDIFANADNLKCSDECFRPVGFAIDGQGRVFVSSDATGELYVLAKIVADEVATTSASATASATASAAASAATPSKTSAGEKVGVGLAGPLGFIGYLACFALNQEQELVLYE